MAIEIERKFLLSSDAWKPLVCQRQLITQGYLSFSPVVRIRTVEILDAASDKILTRSGVLTIKGKSKGLSRSEFEYDVPDKDADQMLAMSVAAPLKKIRHLIKFEDMLWEVDEFLAANKGLIVAEIELDSEDQAFVKPSWVGKEISMDRRYSNSNLAKRPFEKWKRKC